ncbi:hypothetical protein, partial [Frankia sp. Cr1]|uniref:hypothetical protein n=1 Tax=Frankia sp. Cr1 TaxID=3073931 RepID=UPI002AD446F3
YCRALLTVHGTVSEIEKNDNDDQQDDPAQETHPAPEIFGEASSGATGQQQERAQRSTYHHDKYSGITGIHADNDLMRAAAGTGRW